MELTQIEKSALEILLKAYDRNPGDAYVFNDEIQKTLGLKSYWRFATRLLDEGWIRSGFVSRKKSGFKHLVTRELAWKLTRAGRREFIGSQKHQTLPSVQSSFSHQLRNFLLRLTNNDEWRHEATIMLVLLDAGVTVDGKR